ncbi:MAG: hypothetical protein DRO67_03540 [Candidatus Asgardarchaeum californiense]|nr:MAG: hypothetical protein DRO67_03540 [Candidatus Asgardarchaeum californiense]
MVDIEKDERRSFFGPDEETKYYIQQPTAEDIRGADWQYSKVFTQCLVEGITTSAEMMDILTRRGIIGPEFEQRANELSDRLAQVILDLEKAVDMDEKKELSLKVASAREDLYQWNQRLNGPMNNTAEQIADDARLEYLTSAMVVDSDGNKVWDSYDVYLKEKSQALALRARFEVMLFLQGLDSDFLDQTPEAVAMREVEKEIMKKSDAVLAAAKAVKQERTPKRAPKKRSTTNKRKPTAKRDVQPRTKK